MASVVDSVLGGSDGDETILDYVKAVLEDEFFEWGEGGEGAFEAFGPILVREMCMSVWGNIECLH